MKKILGVIVFVTLFTYSGIAQNEDYKNTVCVNAGFSLIGAVVKAIDNAADGDYTTKASGMPVLEFTYDRGIAKWFSIGAAVGYQKMGVDYQGYSYLDDQGNTVVEDFTMDLSRLNIAIRPLFHYGNSGRVDMYSGMRIGYTNWSFNTTTTDPNFEGVEKFNGGHPGFQLILFGIRAYITENIGLNTEFAIGGPHYLSAGLNCRF